MGNCGLVGSAAGGELAGKAGKRPSDSAEEVEGGGGGSKREGAGEGPLPPPAGPSSGNTQSLMSLIVC